MGLFTPSKPAPAPLILSVCFGLFFLYVLVSITVNYRKLRTFRGPLLAKLSGIWLFWQSCNKNVYEAEKAALKRYGSPARIGPNLLVTDDPDVIRHINAPSSKWSRSTWYEAMKMDPRVDTVFSTRDEKVHSKMKAMEVGAYNGRDVPRLEIDIEDRIKDLIKLVSRSDGKRMDFAMTARFFTLDVLSTVAFGRKFGFMEANADLWEYDKTSAGFMNVIELTANHPWIHRILASSIMQNLAAPRVTDKSGIGPVLAFARKAVSERFENSTDEHKDMLNYFKTKGLSQVQMEAEAYLQIIAGSDSTTTILRSILYTLVGTPSVYTKLSKEIDDAVKAGAISSPVVKYAEARKLRYLDACIWEGIRMYPPIFGLKTKTAPPGGETIKGIYYPGGCDLGMCDENMMRNQDTFGPDADLYRPERWLNADHDIYIRYARVVDIVFGAGRFVCLGKHIAMMELYKAFVEASTPKNINTDSADCCAASPTF
ncbi:hypothetical protein LTR95_000951 [Oleoguttula sp. CCFEE 5521]